MASKPKTKMTTRPVPSRTADSPASCTRQPCDRARRGHVHPDGEPCYVLWDRYYDYPSLDQVRWTVLATAAPECEWDVRLELGDGTCLDMNVDEVDRLMKALLSASKSASDSNRREDGDYAVSLSRRIFELEHGTSL